MRQVPSFDPLYGLHCNPFIQKCEILTRLGEVMYYPIASTYISLSLQGLIAGQAGSTFLDLQIITNTDTDKASVMFTGTSVGYLVGSIVCGLIYDRFNKSLLLFLSLVGNAIATISVPFCPLLGIMLVFRSLQGFFGGAVETGE